jgi:hypothetical protein
MSIYGRDDKGEPVQGQVRSSDASGGVEITLYDDAGSSRALASDERLAIDSFTLSSDPGGDCRLFCDTDDDNAVDAGEEFFRATVVADGTVSVNMPNAFLGAAGAKPHVIAPSGNVDVSLRGRITKTISRTDPQKPHYVG